MFNYADVEKKQIEILIVVFLKIFKNQFHL